MLTGKPSRNVPNHPGQLSLQSPRGMLIEYQPLCLGLGGARSRVSGGRYHCVIPHGTWHPVVLRWSFIFIKSSTLLNLTSYVDDKEKYFVHVWRDFRRCLGPSFRAETIDLPGDQSVTWAKDALTTRATSWVETRRHHRPPPHHLVTSENVAVTSPDVVVG